MKTLEQKVFEILNPEIELRKPKTLEELEKEYVEKKTCPYCKRALELGASGGGQEKWGCYNKDCDIKKKHSKYDYYSVDLGYLSTRIYDLKRAMENTKKILDLFKRKDT